MLVPKEVKKSEIEMNLPKMGDYVKIDYLSQCLKKSIDFDTKKYVMTQLAKLYEEKGMFSEAGKLMNGAAEINTTYLSKMNDYAKCMEMYIKAGYYDDADVALTKAIGCANVESQKVALKLKRKELVKAQAEAYMKRDKRRNAVTAYEKLVSLELVSPEEKHNVQKILLGLYEKLGMVRDFYSLKRNFN